MDLIELNRHILSVKRDHMKNTIKYKKVVKKIVSWINLPDVIYKFICNYVGSSVFPMNIYCIYQSRFHPHSFPKNTALSHHKTLEETKDQAQ
jgi:hypothetical protein